MDIITKAYSDVYVGKEFIYISKYGRAKGVVKRVFRTENFILDEDSEKKILYKVNHSQKGDGTMEKPKLKGEDHYMASRPELHIESTNGVFYKFEECYFLNNI